MKTRKTSPEYVGLSDVDPRYAAACNGLTQLTASLESAKSVLKKEMMVAEQRLGAGRLRTWLRAHPPALGPSFGDESLVERIAKVGQVDSGVLKNLRHYFPDVKTLDAYDQEIFTGVFEREAAVALLEFAIDFQKENVERQKKIAIAALRESIAPVYKRSSRAIAETLLPFLAAVIEGRRLCEFLARQDPELPNSFEPTPFPLRVSPDPALFAWLRAAAPDLADDCALIPIAEESAETAAQTAIGAS